jgi:hypothetical protein
VSCRWGGRGVPVDFVPNIFIRVLAGSIDELQGSWTEAVGCACEVRLRPGGAGAVPAVSAAHACRGVHLELGEKDALLVEGRGRLPEVDLHQAVV